MATVCQTASCDACAMQVRLADSYLRGSGWPRFIAAGAKRHISLAQPLAMRISRQCTLILPLIGPGVLGRASKQSAISAYDRLLLPIGSCLRYYHSMLPCVCGSHLATADAECCNLSI